ncbi:MAG: Ig-like domain-containing protein, partial [Candidatus Thorarchaeota archaeon]
VYFTVSATDLGSGISAIELSVDGVLETTTTGDTISWNTREFENGNYTLAFTANDNAGNTATIELEYMVQNPVGFEGIIEGLQNVMSQYGFFVGAAAVVLVYAGGTVLIRRRAGAARVSSGSSKVGAKGAKKKSTAKKKKSTTKKKKSTTKKKK